MNGWLTRLDEPECCELCDEWICEGSVAVVFEDGVACTDCIKAWS